jgi:hypothetical protein
VLIVPNDPINEEFLGKFEKIHESHTLITIEESEVKDNYENLNYEKEN